MGIVCCKPLAITDSQDVLKKRLTDEWAPDIRFARINSSKREEEVTKNDSSDLGLPMIDGKVIGSKRVYDDEIVQRSRDKAAEVSVATSNHPGMGIVPNALQGEQVAAGWPSWLAHGASEAIRGWVPRRADTFEKLDKIGEGTYSNVYKARDVLSGKIVALKKVRFDIDPEGINFMAREILVLRRLDHPNIIKLEGLITSRRSCSLYLIFEYMEHDLTGLTSIPGINFTEPQVKCYMHQLLSGLDHCHSRGILHRDIKGSNLLIDNNGILKIADFGLASFFDRQNNLPMTSRVVTLWYRPPELLLGATHYDVAVDLWGSGCVLGELFFREPIMPGRTEVEQLHKIFKLCGSPSEVFWKKSKLPYAAVFKPQKPYKRIIAETFQNFPATAVGLLETLLSIDPAHRGTAARALNSEFFTAEPNACDPSSLPKYPPSKEIDAKLRDEEAKRQRETHGVRFGKSGEVPAPNANVSPRQVGQSNSNTVSHSGSFENHVPLRWERSRKKHEDRSKAPSRLELSATVGSSSQFIETSRAGLFLGPAKVWDSTSMQDHKRHPRKTSDVRHTVENRAYLRESTMHGHRSTGSKMPFSGPLFASAYNVDMMLREHDQHIQQLAKHARVRRRIDA